MADRNDEEFPREEREWRAEQTEKDLEEYFEWLDKERGETE